MDISIISLMGISITPLRFHILELQVYQLYLLQLTLLVQQVIIMLH